MVWAPRRTIKECDAILCGPGMPHEMESRVVDGRVLRVYKNLWPSLRSFWLWATSEFSDKTYIVYEDNRSTFEQILSRSLLAASVFKNVYHVQKGDRVAICARNIPDYLVAYWAYVERAQRVYQAVNDLFTAGVTGLILFDVLGRDSQWKGVDLWENVMQSHKHDPRRILLEDPNVQPEDNATIIFTSGTCYGSGKSGATATRERHSCRYGRTPERSSRVGSILSCYWKHQSVGRKRPLSG
ncbi:hypothetical protein PHLCEN_2v4823 [Hermanssonia centrifuga]|uniref:AMP-dependent synthetase/ligase domain-containing protein n=1 Tax=Hermanssonia centrifuga TaxID=98765 RepID=A0A2R6PG66_9APHY|nr:hypothetical protein PHLCEN_2v4823 [Hermanssonia centrifuga]